VRADGAEFMFTTDPYSTATGSCPAGRACGSAASASRRSARTWARWGPPSPVDLDGGTLLPGFIDAHAHPVFAGHQLRRCDLVSAHTQAGYLDIIARYASDHPDEEWITGGGWEMAAFPGGIPAKGPLDAVVPDRPVYLPNRDGHGASVNSRALLLAGIDARTPDPPDGRIERDADGEPAGMLQEGAAALVSRLLPAVTDEDWYAGLEIPSRLDGIGGLRIALSVDLGCYAVDDVAANTRAAAERLREAGATVTEVALPWQREMINRAARIHFGMIFGPSVREIYAAHADELTSYARRFVAESDAVGKDEFVAGLELECRIYAPLGQLLDQFDALICPTFAIPALPAEYDTDQPVQVNGQDSGDWLDVLMTLPFNIASRCRC